MSDHTVTSVRTGSANETQRIAATPGDDFDDRSTIARSGLRDRKIRRQSTRRPAARTASLTPSAYASKFSANIRTSRAAARS